MTTTRTAKLYEIADADALISHVEQHWRQIAPVRRLGNAAGYSLHQVWLEPTDCWAKSAERGILTRRREQPDDHPYRMWALKIAHTGCNLAHRGASTTPEIATRYLRLSAELPPEIIEIPLT